MQSCWRGILLGGVAGVNWVHVKLANITVSLDVKLGNITVSLDVKLANITVSLNEKLGQYHCLSGCKAGQ